MALNCKTCYFTFGRFQPPTTGHKDNFDGVNVPQEDMIIAFIFLNPTTLKERIPSHLIVNYSTWRRCSQNIWVKSFGPKQPVEILQDLMMAGYNEAVFLVGSDRVNAMQFLHKYNGTEFSS